MTVFVKKIPIKQQTVQLRCEMPMLIYSTTNISALARPGKRRLTQTNLSLYGKRAKDQDLVKHLDAEQPKVLENCKKTITPVKCGI